MTEIVTIPGLLQKSYNKYNNVNIVIATILLKELYGKSAIVFGGLVRDVLSDSKSNDIDILFTKNLDFHTYKYEDGIFVDKFIIYIKSILEKYNIEISSIVRQIDVLSAPTYFEKEEGEENQDTFTSSRDKLVDELVDNYESLMKQIENPEFTPEHLKYDIVIKINDVEYTVNMDFSFLNSPSEQDNTFPTTADSFYMECTNENIIFNSLENIIDYWKINSKSFLSEDTEILKFDTMNKKFRINNIDKAKRVLKVTKLLDNGWIMDNTNTDFICNNLSQYSLESQLSRKLNEDELNSLQKLLNLISSEVLI